MTEHWMQTDEREDVLSSLKLFIDSQKMVGSDDSYWKWSVISMHSAVQSAMAFHLSFGNDLLVMAQKDAEAWLTAHYNDTAYPETQMDSFLNLYKKIKAHRILGVHAVSCGKGVPVKQAKYRGLVRMETRASG